MHKEVVTSQVTLLPDGYIEVQVTVSAFDDDGSFIGQKYVRHAIHPGQDYSREEFWTREICRMRHTPETIEAYDLAEAAKRE